VLLVGGGIGGALREILKEPSLITIDYVELDPGLISLARDVLPGRLTSALADRRVSLHHTDGRRFLQATETQYDVIVMDLPPPYTAQLNRFYTREIFAVARRHLREGGIFSFSAPGVQEYISDELAAFLASLYRTSAGVFARTEFLPVGKTIFVCSPGVNRYVSSSPDRLLARLRERHIETLFLREYFLRSMLSPDRLEYARERVLGQKGKDFNADLKPISFYYDLVMWSAEYEGSVRVVLAWLSTHSWSLPAATVAVGLIFLGLGRSRRRRTLLPLAALATSGFAAIVLELEVVLSFQLFYGSLYDRIGLLLTSYMVGLGLGAFLEKRAESETGRVVFRPALVQILTACLALTFLCTVLAIARVQEASLLRVFEWTFLAFALAAGGLGGALFSSASRAYFLFASGPDGRDVGRAGVTYAWDLAGSWVGAALCSVVLFPVAGIVSTTIGISFLLLVSGAGLLSVRGKGDA
jgi:spermidine synthase